MNKNTSNTLELLRTQNQRTIELLLNQLEKNNQLELELKDVHEKIKHLGGDVKRYQSENSQLKQSLKSMENNEKYESPSYKMSLKELERLEFLEKEHSRLKSQNQQLKYQNENKQSEVNKMIRSMKNGDDKQLYSHSPNETSPFASAIYDSATEEVKKELHEDKNGNISEELQAHYNQVIKELEKIDRNDLVQLKSVRAPPQIAREVAKAVCILFEIKPEKIKDSDGQYQYDYWGPWKKLVGNIPEFIKRLIQYDKDNVDVSTLRKVKKIIEKPDFTKKRVEQCSKAAAGMFCWVNGIYRYNENKLMELQEAHERIQHLGGDILKYQTENSDLKSRIQSIKDQTSNSPLYKKEGEAYEEDHKRLEFLEKEYSKLKSQNQQLNILNSHKQSEVAKMLVHVKNGGEDNASSHYIKSSSKEHLFIQTQPKQQSKYQQQEVKQQPIISEELQKRLLAYREATLRITKGDLTQLKSLKNPTLIVKQVIKAMCILFNIKPEKKKDFDGKVQYDYWAPGKSLIADPTFMAKLIQYDKDNVDVNTIKKVKKFIDSQDFTLTKARNASMAVEGMMSWVFGIYYYNEHKLNK